IFKQLKTPVNDDDISKISSSKDDTKTEILLWYHYAEGFEKQVKKILNNTRITTNKSKSKVYRELLTRLVDVDLQTLQKRTQRANTVYNLFKKIGVDKIRRIKIYGFYSIADLTIPQIKTIENYFLLQQLEISRLFWIL
ncbi:186_t:CDS:2, partial [Racocetra fulgida]